MKKFYSINPTTEEKLEEFEYSSVALAKEKVAKAHAAFLLWRKCDVKERSSYLSKLTGAIRKGSRKYARLATIEMGKPINQAISEIEKCTLACEYHAQNAERFLEDEKIETESKKSYVAYEPMGVILGIMPWNFPFWQVFRFAAATLAAGNTIIVKHASNVPQCALAIEEIFREAGFPAGVYQNVFLEGKDASALIADPRISGVSMTGSTSAGAKVAQTAGENIKKAVFELGGSDAFIVTKDADLEKAARIGITARFQNNGQSCIAAKRFLVHESIAEEFKKQFSEEILKLRVGDPLFEKTDVGPLARSDLRIDLEDQLARATAQGAKILWGGKKIERKGFFFEPTIVESTKKTILANEETFGPLATIIVGKTDEELISIANSTQYGLGGSIWCKDLKVAEKYARELQCGMASVNTIVKTDPRLPCGGTKTSGLGRELGSFGIREFTNIKAVVIN
ncbi:NAD-dependent succinate-semialdehyde dehydrogenase [Candidatus Micrarchaeota archaeon]|nr:NAD-dependent succinate-semialdehyde dehydrogenase [Candidatus Micrarchaeota archaeon]